MSKKIIFEANERNKAPILEVLQKIIPEKFKDTSPLSVFEVGSGTGMHATYFCSEMKQLIWQPSDIDEKLIESIKAYTEESQLDNIKQPIVFDISDPNVLQTSSIDKEYNIMVAINLMHITPWKCTEGLFSVAGNLLPAGGLLITYGPYSIQGEITPESNVKFDEKLKADNPEWGLRDTVDLENEAKKNGLTFDAMFDMPSNNKTLIWLKQDNLI